MGVPDVRKAARFLGGWAYRDGLVVGTRRDEIS